MTSDLLTMLHQLPGAALIIQGIDDIAAGRDSAAAELVKIGSPRLRDCGLKVDVSAEDALNADHRLYRLLGAEHGRLAYSQYNALLRQLVSFEQALEHRVFRFPHSSNA